MYCEWLLARVISNDLAAELTEVAGSAWNVSRTQSTIASSSWLSHCAFFRGQIFLKKNHMPYSNSVVGEWWFLVFVLVKSPIKCEVYL